MVFQGISSPPLAGLFDLPRCTRTAAFGLCQVYRSRFCYIFQTALQSGRLAVSRPAVERNEYGNPTTTYMCNIVFGCFSCVDKMKPGPNHFYATLLRHFALCDV